MSRPRTIEVALIQRGPAGPDLADNLRENLRLIEEAGTASPDFICLNELSTTPYFPRNPQVEHVPYALLLDSEAIREVGERARRIRCHIVYPFYELLPDTGERLNSVVLIGPEGTPVSGSLPGGGKTVRFSKTHLAATPKTGVDEHHFFSAGEGFAVFDTPKARVGLLVCYDRRFPEGWRTLALQGAEVVFMVADVPAWAPSPSATAEEMFHIELRTRALENLYFVAGCNKAGIERVGEVETRFFGRSCVIDPYGGLLAEAPPDEPMILRATLDLDRIAEARGNLPYFDERRPDLYRLISEPPSRTGSGRSSGTHPAHITKETFVANAIDPHFGLLLPNDGYPVVQFDHLRTLAREAEALDFDSAWVADHFLAPPGLSAAFGTKGIFEATMVLAALSSITERIHLGTSVLLFPMRHPIHLANLIATLDHASKGRLILGFGVGGYKPEFDACEIPYNKRGRMTDEELDILKALFIQDNVSFEGDFYRFQDISFEPKPYSPGGPPIVSGGDVGKTLERVAKHTRGWMPWGGRIEQMQEGMAAIKSRAVELGRDPDEFMWGVGFYGCCTRDEDKIRREVEKVAPYFAIHHDMELSLEEVAEKTLIGTPEDITRRLQRFLDIGVNHFIVKHLPFNEEVVSVRMFGREVIPGFRVEGAGGKNS